MEPSPLPDLPDVPAELAVAGAEGHLVVLVGAGASFGAGLPSWDGLLSDLLAVAIREAREPARREELEAVRAEWAGGGGGWDPLTKASLLGQRLGEQRLREAIAERMRVPGAAPTATHRALAALLPGAAFVTTNYDQLLEAAIEAQTGRRPKVVLLDDMEGLRDFGAGQVLKLHGDLDAPERIVLRGEDYFDVGHRAPRAWKERLKALLQPPWRVLLVGYGYGDVDVQEVVSELRGAYEAKLEGPFWLEVGGLRQGAKAKANGLRLIGLGGYGQVVPWLEKLGEAIARRRREAPVMQMALALAGEVLEGFEEKNKDAARRFEEHDLEGALGIYEEMLGAAERLLGAAGEDEEHRRRLSAWAVRCRLNVGVCQLCLQRSDEALATFRAVARGEERLLSAAHRATLAQGLGLMGDLAKARSVMPTLEDAPEGREREHVAVVQQLLEILEGGLPEPLLDRPFLQVHAARYLLIQGDLEGAAQLAMRALDGSSDPILTASALFVLHRCLMRTVWEQTGATRPIPRPREEVVRWLEDGFEILASLRLPEPIKRDAEAMRAGYDVQTDNPERLDEALRQLEALDRSNDPSSTEVPDDAAPWALPYLRAADLASAGTFARAADEATALARQWPNRAPIEHFAAKMLLRVGQPETALEHAQRAFEELPARGYRILLARCQLQSGRSEETWETLKPLATSAHPMIIGMRATAAHAIPARAGEARALFEEYLVKVPDDAGARLRFALTLFRLGDRRRAAEQAWEAATGPGSDRLNADALYACADVQRFEGDGDLEAQHRIRRIADLLRERFPGDLQAERLRFRLLVALGLPEEAPAPDWQRLIQAGDLVKVTTEQVFAMARERASDRATAAHIYRSGHLSFEALCQVTGLPAAVHVERFFQEAQRAPGPLSPPVAVGESHADLNGVHLLVGELELLLLYKLKLFRALRAALGPNGRLLLFEDVLHRVLAGVYVHDSVDVTREEAARLALEVQQAVGAGQAENWIELRPRPRVQDLPPLRDDLPTEVRERLEPQREEFAQALAYLDALAGPPALRLLNADYFVEARLGTYPELAMGLAWHGEEPAAASRFEAFVERFDEARTRVLHLPQLLPALVASAERRGELRLMLAQLGFSDALGPDDLLALARRPEGLTAEHAVRTLDGAERITRDALHPGATLARVQLADVYSKAIWRAFCGVQSSTPTSDAPIEGALPQAEREALTGRLLGRAEAVELASAGDMLDLIIQFVAGQAMMHRMMSFIAEDDGELASLSNKSAAAMLWEYLDKWAGPTGRRRSAYGRGLREAWRLVDRYSAPVGPMAMHQVAPLILTAWRATTTDLRRPDLAAPAILSALWSYKPLNDMGAYLQDEDGYETSLKYEPALRAGVDVVENHPEEAAMGEDVLTYLCPISDTHGRVQMLVPPEAILLRMSTEHLPRFAVHLASLQGPHDGRAYRWLNKIADDPGDVEHRRTYAHLTLTAPWRAVREDPASIRTWRNRAPLDGRTFPNSLEDLREMLSEPPRLLPDAVIMRDLLDKRLRQGEWAPEQRDDRGVLFMMACEIPGALPSMTAQSRLANGATYPEEVALALHRLRTPEDRPVGQLCADIFFLRLAAARAPIVDIPLFLDRDPSPENASNTDHDSADMRHRQVDLREELPGVFAGVLRATIATPPSDSLARLEPGLLRLCGRVVQQLSYWPHIPAKDGLWLAHRLYRWLCAQLEALEPDARRAGLRDLEQVCPLPLDVPQDDLLHPLTVQRERFDLRLASVLLALAYMDTVAQAALKQEETDAEEASASSKLRSVSSAALESLLLDLAARPLTEEERRLRRLGFDPSSGKPSRLDWFGPAAVPDLALTVLLKLNLDRFADLPEEARMRWIQDIPLRAGDTDAVIMELGLRHIISAIAKTAEKLTSAEHIAIEDRLRRMEDFEGARDARWLIFTRLYKVGRQHLGEEVRVLLLKQLRHQGAPYGFSEYLAALSRQAPDRIEPETEAILAAVKAEGLDPIPFAIGIGGAIFSGDHAGIPACQRLLRRLAAERPYQDDERFLQLLHTLGLGQRG